MKLFGTDGIRGKAGEYPLDEATIHSVGASLARLLTSQSHKPAKLVVGRDPRESGPAIEQALIAGAVSEGAECHRAGIITTPGVAYLTAAHKYDAGVVVSASHNPYDDNGIKIFRPTGQKLVAEDERTIEEDIRAGSSVPYILEPVTNESEHLRAEYIDHLRSFAAGLDLSGLRMVVDCANGAASDIAPAVLRSLGAALTVINAAPDGRNINKDCGSLHLEGLAAQVLATGSEIGIAFDGDADRALFVDAAGETVDGDAVLLIMAEHLMARGELANRKVVATVMSNIGLEIALKSRGVELVRTAVGDKYVLEELLRSGSDVGGEQSGHIIFPKVSLVGDGIVTALSVLEAIRARGISLAEAVSGFVRFPQVLVNVRVKEKRPFELVEPIASAAADLERELDGDGRLLLRYSGTENLARVMIEGRDQAVIEQQAGRLAKIIGESLG
jgi:phosphoglucosamine mutase